MSSHSLAPDPRPVEAAPDGSRKRRQVLQAAEQLFLSLGYEPVSMEAVARAACVSKATLYAHFASKAELFATIVRERGLLNSADQTLLADHVTDLRAALQVIGQRILRFMLQERTLAIYRIAIAESARFPELGHAFHANGPQHFCDRVTAWLAVQQQAGLVRATDCAMAANQFSALLRSGVFLRASLGLPPPPSEAEIERTVTDAVDTWLRAFGAAEASDPPPAR